MDRKNGEPVIAHHSEYIEIIMFIKAKICTFSVHQQEYIKFP